MKANSNDSLAGRVRSLISRELPLVSLEWKSHVLDLRRPRFVLDLEYAAASATVLRWLSALGPSKSALADLARCYQGLLDPSFVCLSFEGQDAAFGQPSGAESLRHLGVAAERVRALGHAVTAESEGTYYLCVPICGSASPRVLGTVTLARSSAFTALDADFVGFTALALVDLLKAQVPSFPTGHLSPQRRETRAVRERARFPRPKQRPVSAPLTTATLFLSEAEFELQAV